ncbi:MAG: class I SAM-dependent methyltransferase [Gammaproteobacteria bacterium]|nr:MAG: class I SAM-dependent methyltransferase [Gammaproteobacteria bacterium]UTW41938.1 class I SAM-dependent methyltransferase [bacterium SCSIO 12844]
MPKSNPKSVYQSYNQIADWFSKHRSNELFEKPYLDWIIQHIKPSARILDLGCGNGKPILAYFYDQGFEITGVDASIKMIEIAKKAFPKCQLILKDMRVLKLNQKFDVILAWHSFFHLPPEDQKLMFGVFEQHIKKDGYLLFTAGPSEGEVYSDNGGIELYHASLSPKAYESLLKKHHFKIIQHKKEDPQLKGATFYLAQYN